MKTVSMQQILAVSGGQFTNSSNSNSTTNFSNMTISNFTSSGNFSNPSNYTDTVNATKIDAFVAWLFS